MMKARGISGGLTPLKFENEAQDFLSRLALRLKENGIDLGNWSIDHLCYRCETLERYERLKNDFAAFGELLIESPVNGRPIATYKLSKPVTFGSHQISVVELPAPKAGKVTREGFEHVEAVIDCDFNEIRRRFPKAKFDEGGLTKSFNPELEIDLGDCAIKFHHLSLEEVVRIERAERARD